MSTRGLALALPLAIAGCASVPPEAGQAQRLSAHVDGQVLPEQSDGTAAGFRVERYTPQPAQRFRMPRAELAPPPALPAAMATQTLAPTKVCARVAIAADGAVMFATPLLTRTECAAGAQPANAPLLQATLAALRGWHFRPAAMCTFPAGQVPDDPGDCAQALTVSPLPVTLEFAFTFEVNDGHARVSTQAP